MEKILIQFYLEIYGIFPKITALNIRGFRKLKNHIFIKLSRNKKKNMSDKRSFTNSFFLYTTKTFKNSTKPLFLSCEIIYISTDQFSLFISVSRFISYSFSFFVVFVWLKIDLKPRWKNDFKEDFGDAGAPGTVKFCLTSPAPLSSAPRLERATKSPFAENYRLVTPN